MPIPIIHQAAFGRDYRVFKQVFAGASNKAGSNIEDQRRRGFAQTTAAPVQVQAAAPAQQPAAAAPKPPPPQAVIDRLHKMGVSRAGGYIYVARDHDGLDSGQTPPTNPAYRGPGVTVSTISDALSTATMLAPQLKPGARIVVIPIGGTWNENLAIGANGIDLYGHGRPKITGHMVCSSDAAIEGLDLTSMSTTPALQLILGSGVASMRSVRCYGLETAFHAQTLFSANDCEFHQTTTPDLSREVAAAWIEVLGPASDYHRMKNCRFYSTLNSTDLPYLGSRPNGFAVRAESHITGPLVVKVRDMDCYINPNSGLLLDECEVEGSLLCQGWTVKHIGGRQHGGVPHPSSRGNIYARLRGMPLFDPVNGFYANVEAMVSFDATTVGSSAIAEFVPWNGSYPVGVVPSVYPGGGYVAFRNSEHLRRYDNAAASPWVFASSVAATDVVQSSTGCASWLTSNVNTLTYGDCPTGVLGNMDLLLI